MRRTYAAELTRGGLIDLTAFHEPGRLEGKKTLGFEISENFGADLPDVIVCPTGGGTGLVGIWKALGELRRLGEISHNARLPRMIAVQTANCSPLVSAFERQQSGVPVVSSSTLPSQEQDPAESIMGHTLLEVLKESKGHAVAVSEIAIKDDGAVLGRLGLTGGYESAATLSALRKLIRQGVITRDEKVQLIFTS